MNADLLEQERVRSLVGQKEAWILKQPQATGERRERFTNLRALNQELGAFTQEQERATHQAWELAKQEIEANSVLQRRDYSFCLYPESKLRSFCAQAGSV